MRKTVLSLLLIFVFQQIFSQVNEPANWPNASWTLSGVYEPFSIQGDPTSVSNFGFSDEDAGDGSINNIAAESPIVDITPAITAGENFIIINSTYVFNFGNVGDSLTTQYWDADTSTWSNWGTPIEQSTPGSAGFNFCDGPFVAFSTDLLDISSFTASQLTGFRYRIVYDDGGDLALGFCMSSPTLTSSTGPSACPDVSNISVSDIAIDNANISWDLGGVETAWEVTVQPQGTGVPTTNGQAAATNINFNASGLNESIAYEVYVRANCLVDGFSNWIGPINFRTLRTPPTEPVGVTCASGTSSIIFSEEFGLVQNEDPLGWTGTGFDGDGGGTAVGGQWSITQAGTNTPNTGPLEPWDAIPGGIHLEYETEGNATDVARAITPAIDMGAAVDGAELSFYMHAYGSAIGELNIGVSTSATGPFNNEFSWTGELQTSESDAWVPVGVNLDAYMGQIIYLEFAYEGSGTDSTGDIALDAIKVESCGDFCIVPSDIVVSNLMTTSADINWTSNGSETNWEYVVQPAGTGLPTGNGLPATTTNVNVPSLMPSTVYEVYVRANCLTDGFSLWYGPIRFTTLSTPPPPPVGVTCTNGTLTDIFTEDFGLVQNTPPVNWTGNGFTGNIENGKWRITNADANTINTGPFNSWDTNPGVHLEYEGSGNSTNVASAITPAIDLTSVAGSAELSFYLHAYGASIGKLEVGVSLSPTGPFNPVFTWTGGLQIADTDAWVPVGVNLDGAIGETLYIEFSYAGAAGSDGTADIAIDQIKIESCIVACAAPSDLAVTGITTTSADISWTPNAGEFNWEYVVQPAGTGIPTGNGIATTVTSITDNTLSPATAYEVYVRANCLTDGFSEWITIPFSTLNNMTPPPPVGVNCTVGTANIAFEEGFGLIQNTDPLGWTGTDFSGDSGKWRISNPGTNSTGSGPLNSWDGNPGVHLEYETTGSSTNIDSAITPAIDLSTAMDGAELSFYMHAFGSGIGVLNIGVSTSATGPFTPEYSWAGDFQTTDAEAWVPIGIPLDAYLGQTIFIEFSYGGSGNDSLGDIAIDAIKVESCGEFCLAPTNLAVTDRTMDSAVITWDAGASETNWEYVVQPVGTGLPAGSGTAVATNSETVTGLTPLTEYEVYVRANCLANGFSNWVGPIPFKTLKTPPPIPVGVDCSAGGTLENVFTETFGTVERVDPIGWTGTGFDGGVSIADWAIILPGTINTTLSTGPLNSYDGLLGVHMEYSAQPIDAIVGAVTPAIDLSQSINNAELSFYMHAYGEGIGTLNIGVSTSATGPFTTEFTWEDELQGADSDDWAHVGVNLDAYLGQVIFIEFAYKSADGSFNGDIAIDQIEVNACTTSPTCEAPTAITITGITETEADVSWTPNNGETEWEYAVVLSGAPVPTSGTIVNMPNVTVSGLDPNTDYDFYVLANCSATSESPWSALESFTTLATATCEAPTAITITGITETEIDVSWTPNNGETEWEYAVVLSGVPAPTSGTIASMPNVTVSGLDPDTDYDFYVLANCSATLESPWSIVEPFTTLATATCEAPTAITITGITETEADVSWTPNNGETEWEYAVVLSGAPAPTNGTIINMPNVTVSGLDPDTDYDFYVLANCSATLESPWSIVEPFSTLAIPTCTTPSAGIVDDITTCDDSSGDGIEAFNLGAQTATILGTQDPATIIVTYHDSLIDAQNGDNALLPILIAANATEIFVRVEDTTISGSTCVNTSTSFTLLISGTIPDVINPSDLKTCDDISRDGFEFFDLTSNTLPILGSLNSTEYTVTYYASLTDAQTEMNSLSSPYENVSNPQTIYARVNRVGTTNCFKTVNFDLIVNDIPETTFDSSEEYEICAGTSMPIAINPIAVNYTEAAVAIQWFYEGVAISGENTLELTNVLEAGRYTINVTFNGTRCSSEADIIVSESENCNIPQGISPNGDGFNDSFDLSSFGVQNLEIYNRSGTLVYSRKDYVDEWKGQSNGGDELPVGTYYYIMEFEGDQVKSAWVYINK